MNNHQFRALVVDDEAPMREELALLLQEHDFIVETAVNGEEGLQKLLTDEFDVAVVDLKMPKMGGLEMIHKADEADVDAYVVILTGHGDKDDAIEALRLQRTVKDWFEKPILDADAFAERVKRIADGVSLEYVRQVLSRLPPSL
jgi:DNA-binding NtrC family response regulator